MINLVIGIAIGAAFSKYWIAGFNWAKEKALEVYSKIKEGK